ncbi:MAG: ATP-binding protein, partial [Chloroflexota bacterium]
VSLANLASSAIANAQQFRQIQAAEARYLGLFEDSIDPIILTDVEGRIVEANRRAVELLGYGRDELAAMHVGDLHAPGSTLPDLRQSRPFQEGEVRVFTSRIIPRNNNLIPVEVHAKSIVTSSQELLQWIHHDISEQLELQALREDLMAMLLHDLQNPLGNIIASLELIGYELNPSENEHLATMLDIAKRSSERLRVLIRSLLDVSRLEAGEAIAERRPVHLPRLVEEAAEFVQPSLLRRRLTLRLKLEPDLPAVYVDEDMIRRVLTNLMDNATKFSEDGKGITVEASSLFEETRLLVSVSDQGPGIPDEYRQLIFDKFQRLPGKDARKGMGLGLAFCRLAVEAHGGRIWVTDAPGGGAKFNFTLPTTGQ